ncbi:Interleukin-1 receptor-associated kinase 4 [Lamellibrachia satsuma]|nr:Interleukin-1 receptor-associated kinase 4 [Lamellibrachia satsuma]
MTARPPHCSPETVIRQLPVSAWTSLRRILDPDDKWKDLASIIKARNGALKFNSDDVLNLALQLKYGRSPTEMLLQSWAMDNVKAATLRDVLVEAQLIRAANVLNKLFGEDEVEEQTAQPEFDIPNIRPDIPAEVQHFGYETLELATSGFNDTPYRDGGNLIGAGGYGQVFIGEGSSGKIAVKRLVNNSQSSGEQVSSRSHKSDIIQQFNKEIEILSRFRHRNILPLIGYSTDGPHYCIVTMYMKNGSLQDRLACLDDTAPLTVAQRFDIAVDTVRAIHYLHSCRKEAVIHRDVKSANVLLDKDFTAKLADCALARLGPTDRMSSVTATEVIIGTTVYMPPEYKQYGTISTKIDSYSYGVVLLELLTGLPSYDNSREDIGLTEHISEAVDKPEDILSLLDRSATDWPESVAISIYKLAKRCLDSRKRRPEITEIFSEMEKHQRAILEESRQTS